MYRSAAVVYMLAANMYRSAAVSYMLAAIIYKSAAVLYMFVADMYMSAINLSIPAIGCYKKTVRTLAYPYHIYIEAVRHSVRGPYRPPCNCPEQRAPLFCRTTRHYLPAP